MPPATIVAGGVRLRFCYDDIFRIASACHGERGTRFFGGLPTEPGTSPAAHIAVSLARSMVHSGKPPFTGETTGDLFRLGFADPPPMGLTGPSSLENVHWTFSRAFGPPKGKAEGERRAIEIKPSPLGKVAERSEVE